MISLSLVLREIMGTLSDLASIASDRNETGFALKCGDVRIATLFFLFAHERVHWKHHLQGPTTNFQTKPSTPPAVGAITSSLNRCRREIPSIFVRGACSKGREL